MTELGRIEEVDIKKNSIEIYALARFAVDEHNKKENAMLQFVKVDKAERQVVAGFMYYITIEATDGGVKKVYEAKVLENAVKHLKELQEFKLIGDAPAEAST